MSDSGVRVTVTDLASNEVETAEIWDEYLLVTAGSCKMTNVQVYPGTGTHVITVKGVRPQGSKALRADTTQAEGDDDGD